MARRFHDRVALVVKEVRMGQGLQEGALQDALAPQNACFGCGAANSAGLQIKSYADGAGPDVGEALVCTWHAAKHHEAFEGMISGGILGTLLDCHSNWTAAYNIMRALAVDELPCTVTAQFEVKLLRPTPSRAPVVLRAWPVELSERKARVEASLHSGDDLCVTFGGLFVAVKPDHPAYHRW